MKKTRFLALALVVAIMLMGAGYAFWTEALEIDGAVDTGELNFKFLNVEFEGGDHVTGSAKRTDEEHKLDLKFHNMHPGSTATVKFDILNNGTIPLKLNGFKFSNGSEYLEQLGVKVNGHEFRPIKEFVDQLTELELGVNVSESYTLEFFVYKCADEDNFKEKEKFEFSIAALARQYNDDGSCEQVVPGNGDTPSCPGHHGWYKYIAWIIKWLHGGHCS